MQYKSLEISNIKGKKSQKLQYNYEANWNSAAVCTKFLTLEHKLQQQTCNYSERTVV